MSVLGHIAAAAVVSRYLADTRRLSAGKLALVTVALAAVSLLPDIDLIGEGFGIAEHRGAMHSIGMAALVAAVAAVVAWRTKESPAWWGLAFFASMASHGVLDLFSRGPAVELLWPLTELRLAAPIRPLPTPPVDMALLFGPGLLVLGLELLVFSPMLLWALRRPNSGDRSRSR